MSRHPGMPARLAADLDWLAQTMTRNRAIFGGWTMEATETSAPPEAPERPEDVTEAEWDALGDPGKQALTRVRAERDEARTQQAEAARQLAAARAKPAPPKQTPGASSPTKPGQDVDTIVQKAVEAALAPFVEREEQRAAAEAAARIQTAVTDAAKAQFHDPSDAIANLDLTELTNGEGGPDAAKIKAALEELVTRKPHLAKTTARVGPPGIGSTPAGGTGAPLEDRVKAALAQMHQATGVRNTTTP